MRLSVPFRKIFSMSKRDHGRLPGGGGPGVPFVHQNHINLCGDTCAQMLLLYHNGVGSVGLKQHSRRPGEYRMRRNPRGVLDGATDDDIVATLHNAGRYACNLVLDAGFRWSTDSLGQVLGQLGPIVATMRHFQAEHWILVHGVDAGHVYYHDPWKGSNMRMSIRHFNDGSGMRILDKGCGTGVDDYVASPNNRVVSVIPGVRYQYR